MKAVSLAPWAATVVAIAVALGVSWKSQRDTSDALERAKAAEAAQLTAEGLATDHEVSLDVARKDSEKLVAESDSLRAELERVKAIAPATKIVTVETSIASGPAQGTPLPAASDQPCLLRPGDRLELRIRQLELRTDLGNQILAGSAQVVRPLPSPESILLDAPLHYTLAESGALPPLESPSHWGFGGAAFGGPAGAAYGIALGTPPLRILGHEIELIGSAGLGPRGPQGSALVLLR